MIDLPETLPLVSLVVSVAPGLALEDVQDDAQYLAEALGCTVVFTLGGKLHLIRPTLQSASEGSRPRAGDSAERFG